MFVWFLPIRSFAQWPHSSFCVSNSCWCFRSCKRGCIQWRCGRTKPTAVPWVIHQLAVSAGSVQVCEVLWIKYLHKLGDIDLYQNVRHSCLSPSQPMRIRGGGCGVGVGMFENGKFSCWGKYTWMYIYIDVLLTLLPSLFRSFWYTHVNLQLGPSGHQIPTFFSWQCCWLGSSWLLSLWQSA